MSSAATATRTRDFFVECGWTISSVTDAGNLVVHCVVDSEIRLMVTTYSGVIITEARFDDNRFGRALLAAGIEAAEAIR